MATPPAACHLSGYMSRLIVGLTVLAALAGASTTAAPVPVHLMPKEPLLYYATEMGTKWVYTVTPASTDDRPHQITEAIVESEEVPGGTIVTIEETLGKPYISKKIVVSSCGLYLTWNAHGEHRPYACELKLPQRARGAVGQLFPPYQAELGVRANREKSRSRRGSSREVYRHPC